MLACSHVGTCAVVVLPHALHRHLPSLSVPPLQLGVLLSKWCTRAFCCCAVCSWAFVSLCLCCAFLGLRFKQLVEEIDEEYAAEEKEYQQAAKHHHSSREPEHYADSPYTEGPHDEYSSRKGYKEEESKEGPDFWLFKDEEHHSEEHYSHSQPETHYSEGPEYKPSYEQDHEHNTRHGYGGPEYTPDDSYYNKHYDGREPEHEHEQYGPEHELYHRQYEEEHEPEQYKREEQYDGPEHSHKESEDVCVQEVARSNCVISDTAVAYT